MSTDTPSMPISGVIGAPVKHSRSPLIHGYWLKQHAIAGDYRKFHVEPAELPEFIATMHKSGLVGCNVTQPHKQAVCGFVDRLDPLSRSLGSANTLYFEGNDLCAMTTDGAGFMASLKSQAGDWSTTGRTIAVVGAGGAAAPIIHALVEENPARILLANRTTAKAEALAARFGPIIEVIALSDLPDRLEQCDLLVNATSLGMTGQLPLDLDVARLPGHATVADIVYAPLETDLLKAARARGLATADGLGMLLHQAVPGFEKWFGVRPQVTAQLRQLIVADLMAAG